MCAWIILAFLALFCAFAFAFPSGRQAISLNGEWRFRFASDDRGEEEGWQRNENGFDDVLTVPGCWEAQGIGSETSNMRHFALGVGWYRRKFRTPASWRDGKVWLVVGGAHRSARVWVNGAFAGDHWGYPVGFRLDITNLLVNGNEQELVIAVDSRRHPDRDPLASSFDLLDYMDVDWGGIFGDVTIEKTGASWIEDIFVMPDPLKHKASVKLGISDSSHLGTTLKYRMIHWSLKGKRSKSDTAYANGVIQASPEMSIETALPGAPCWSPESPELLLFDASLLSGTQVLDHRVVRFGLRRIEIRDSHFYLNGERFFLSGYGDDWTFPRKVFGEPNVASWNAYLQRRKKYGFNGVRHHSCMPPDAYLDAADETGLFIQPELPIAYEQFLEAATPKGLDLYRQVWRGYITRMRNHPSVFAWCMGNELWNGMSLGNELYRTAKELDPTRPVIDSDGVWPGAHRPTLDYLSVQFDEGVIPWGSSKSKYQLEAAPNKPVLVHEMSNISTLPNPADIPKYTGGVRPYWLERMEDEVKKRNLADRLPAMRRASNRLQASLLKLNIESARLSKSVQGFYQWLFRDYWNQSTGFVNQFDEPRSISPAYSRKFLDPATLLWERDRVSFHSAEKVTFRIYLSDFRPHSAPNPDTVHINCEDASVILTPPESREVRGLIGPWTGELELPRVRTPRQLRLVATAREVRNEWKIWVFPNQKNIKPANERSAPLIARWITPAVLSRLETGENVLLMGDGMLFPSLNAKFKPAWWHGDEDSDHSFGNMIARHPALSGLPAEGFCDLEMAAMMDNRPVILLDEIPGAIQPIIACLDVPWLMRSKAYLFEASVGKGRLLVCTLNLTKLLRETDPAAEWIYQRLIEYASGNAFRPEGVIPVEWIRTRIRNLPDFDKCVEGFSRIVEASEPARDWYSIRENSAPMFAVRETDGKQFVRWMTADAPSPLPDNTITFAWSGGMGWETEPPGGDFTLSVCGTEIIDFPFTEQNAVWCDARYCTELRYVVLRTIVPDSFGVFLLTVPRSLLHPGKPLEIEVRAPANGSKRWFGLNPFRNILSVE
jgi:beta-galactosidase